MKLYEVDKEYIEFLSNNEKNIMYEKDGKSSRKYIGVLLEINNIKYFAPLSSPKEKHKFIRNIDIIKLDGGRLGVINLNNMLPANLKLVYLVSINNIEDKKYKDLLNEQTKWIKENQNKIKNSASKVYNTMTREETSKLKEILKNRCCDFKKLEEEMEIYCNIKNIPNESIEIQHSMKL